MSAIESLKEKFKATLSTSENGLVTTSYDEDAMIQGQAFAFDHNISILSGATAYMLIDYTTHTSGAGLIFVGPPDIATTIGYVVVNVYRATNYTGGSELIAYNKNTVIGGESETTFTLGATGTTKGTRVLEYLIGGDPTNQSSSGTARKIGTTFLRDSGNRTLVEIVNNAGANIIVNYSQEFFEV